MPLPETPAGAQPLRLVVPAEQYLPGYVAALERGWSPDNVRSADVVAKLLQEIAADPAGYCARISDRSDTRRPVVLPDGSQVQRLPGFGRWLWDGEFCGVIGLRWQPGSNDLPAYVLGHIGYAVVPWKRGRGYATEALRQLLPEAKAEGLAYVELTTDPDNIVSQRVIVANGGILVERFRKPAAYGDGEGLRFRIDLR